MNPSTSADLNHLSAGRDPRADLIRFGFQKTPCHGAVFLAGDNAGKSEGFAEDLECL